MKKRLFYIILICLFAGSGWATVYYVDTTCSGTGSTYDPTDLGGTPCAGGSDEFVETIANVNTLNLNPDDQVLFRKGQAWRGELNVDGDQDPGASGQPVIFTSFGTGDGPKILGSLDLGDTGDWTNELGAEVAFMTNIADQNTSCVVGQTAAGNWWCGQANYSNGSNRNISKVRVYFHTETGEIASYTYVAKIYSMNGTSLDTLLATSDSQSGADIDDLNGGDPIDFTFSTPYSYTASAVIAVVIDGDNSPGDFTNYLQIKASDSDQSVTGNLFYWSEDKTQESDRTPDELAAIFYETPASNLWYATAAIQIGNLIFNSEASTGTKIKLKANVDVQGEFWWDDPNDRVYIYSVGNPGTFYTAIEAAQKIDGFYITADYITVRGFDIRYQGESGINIDGGFALRTGDIIEENYVAFVGGSYPAAETSRYGNGIQTYGAAADTIIRYNRVHEIYDAGISSHSTVDNTAISNIRIYGNVISNTEFAFEHCNVNTGSTTNGVYFYNNTAYNNGGSWGHGQRLTVQRGTGLAICDALDANQQNIVFKNNIVHTATEALIRVADLDSDLDDWTLDYNIYYPDAAAAFMSVGVDTYSFAEWQSLISDDANSSVSDPLFVSNGSDFSLQSTSPAIDAGVGIAGYGKKLYPGGSHPSDVRTGPVCNNVDIGAYERVVCGE